MHLAYPASLQALHLNNKRQIIQTEHNRIKNPNFHPLLFPHFLLPRPLINQLEYNLRKNAGEIYLFNESITCRTKRVDNFFTFQYFNYYDELLL